MRTKKPFLIALFLCMWSIVSYFLLIHQTDTSSNGQSISDPNYNRHRKEILQKIEYLEQSIKQESQIHDELVKKFIHIVRLKDSHQIGKHEWDLEQGGGKETQDKLIVTNNKENDKNYDKPTLAIEQLNNEINGQAVNSKDLNDINKSVKEIEDTALEPNLLPDPKLVENTLKQLTKPYLKNGNFHGPVIPVLVFACNRISVRHCLDNLIEYRPNVDQFPIIVSQDCDDEPTRKVIESYKDVTLIQQPDQNDIFVLPKHKKFKGYYKIARHYGWALNTTFKAGFDYVIIVEDDLNIAPDFYEYFLGTHELLKNDSSLWCVSAWNDNGKSSNIQESRPELLYRTDFFPGLGWMLTKNLWNELSVKWPNAFWDDWIRQPQQRKERACIRPEISRTRTFGKIGVSNGLFFEKHLRYIKLSDQFVHFTKLNLTYLLKNNYDKQFLAHVYSSPVVTYEELRRGMISTKDPVRIQYNTKDQYKRTAKILGLMDDFKSGVPRTGYHGIVSFYYNNQRIYLAPNSNWKGYDLSWS